MATWQWRQSRFGPARAAGRMRRWACAGIWLFAAGCAQAATADDRALIDRVREATQAADVPALAQLYQHPPDAAARAMAAMALERIHGNLAASSADAQTCERTLRTARPEAAWFCAVFANGNLRLQDGAAARQDELDMARRFADVLPAKRLDGIRAYAAAHRNDPVPVLTMPRGDFQLPLTRAPGDDRGALTLDAGGVKARLVVDTGAGGIVLDAAQAERLKVRRLDWQQQAGGFLSRGVAMQAGVLDHATIGPITLDHVPVWIGPGRVNLIGMDVLRRFGRFRIARDALSVYRTAATAPACDQPLLLASDAWGNSVRATVALPIDGELRTVLVDSGSALYLAGNRATAGELATTYAHRVRLGDIGRGPHAARVSEATADVVVAGQPITMTFGVFEDARLPWQYVLGSGALGDMDFYFDFPGRRSCQLLHAGLR